MSVTPSHRAPWSGLHTDDASATIGILGVPFDGAVSLRAGSAKAPNAIRQNTVYVAPVTEEGHILRGLRVRDYGDVERDLNWERYFADAEARAHAALAHPFTLFLGGDHSVSIPLIKAFSARDEGAPFGVIHIDAHPDLAYSYEGSPWSHACTERRVLELPNMQPGNLVFCGLRAWLEEEIDLLAATPAIGVHHARKMHLEGVEAIAAQVIAQLGHLPRIYLTLDIDSLDPAYAPGTGTPEAGGLSSRQLLEFLRLLFAALPIRAMDIVEVAPPLDYSNITTWAAIKIIYEVFGWVGARP